MRDLDTFFNRLGRQIDSVFEHVESVFSSVGMSSPAGTTTVAVRYRVVKDKTSVTIMVEVPGRGSNDITLELANSILTVTAAPNRKIDLPGFTKQFRVNPYIGVDDISASVANGLLTIVVKADRKPAAARGTIRVSAE